MPSDEVDIRSLSITATIGDGDTGPGERDENHLILALDGIKTDVPLNGYRNNQRDTQTNSGRPGPVRRAALLMALQDGQLSATIVDTRSDDNGLSLPAAFETTLTIIVDDRPETRITGGPRKRTSKKKAKFRFTSTEPGSTFVCSVDGQPFAPCSSPHKLKVKKGKHIFRVQATDPSGNTDLTPASHKWKVKRNS